MDSADALKRVTAVLVTYYSKDVIQGALSGLKNCHRVIIIDNGGEDGTEAAARSEIQNVDYIRPEQNLGFGCGVNLAADHTDSEFILIVNPDTISLEADIAKLVASADKYKDAAIVSPMFRDVDGTPHLSYLPLPRKERTKHTLMTDIPEHELCAETIGGAFMLIRRDAFLSIGGFDKAYFLFFEEFDLCQRLRQKGWSTLVNPQSCITHIGGSSSSSTSKASTLKGFHIVWSQAYYKEKHFGKSEGNKFAFYVIRRKLHKLVLAAVRLRFDRVSFLKAEISGALAYLINPRAAPRPKPRRAATR